MKFHAAGSFLAAHAAAHAAAHTCAPSVAAAAAAGVIHMVTVGGATPAAVAGQPSTPVLSFSPDSVFAAPGDIVRFSFMQKNHSVAQSTFDEPCQAMAGGVQSGFMPNPQGSLPAPTFDFQVKDTKPVWMYCQQANHCGQGMVFAVNPANATGSASDKTMERYKQLAISKFGTEPAPAAIAAAGTAQQAAAGQTGTAPAAAAASVAAGNGSGSGEQTCSCHCLCGVNAFPAGAGIGQFGGFLGEMPPASSLAGSAAPTGMALARRDLLHPVPYRVKQIWG